MLYLAVSDIKEINRAMSIGEAKARRAKKEMVEANLRLVISIAIRRSCSATTCSRCVLIVGDHFWRLRPSSSAHWMFVSLAGKSLRKSLRGMRPCLMQISMIIRS